MIVCCAAARVGSSVGRRSSFTRAPAHTSASIALMKVSWTGRSAAATKSYSTTTVGASYGAAVTAASIQFTATGSYVVQFRAVDGVGLASAWAPAGPGAANSTCIL